MYVDTSISDPIGDYVAVGTRNQGAINCFGRKSGELYDGPVRLSSTVQATPLT
ncbi:MAG: hypothetical protein ACLUFT_12060 [Gemmiger formicilis]|uniref:hypothetical protein n=1 Tax=Gemmiger formicilis TaxID=745368 RepID=UPI003993FA95